MNRSDATRQVRLRRMCQPRRFGFLVFRRSAVLLPALLPVVLLLGCVEFRRQTLTYSYDIATDTLKIFQDYQGISAEGGAGSDSDAVTPTELKELDDVLSDQHTFFFCNWATDLSHAEMRKKLAEMKEADFSFDPPAYDRAVSLYRLLLENVHIENGAFYLDADGRLCGVQRVTVTNFSKLITAGNLVIRDVLKEKSLEGGTRAEERVLYRNSVRQQREYIKVKGNLFTLQLPMTRAEYERELGPNNQNSEEWRALKESHVTVRFSNNQCFFSAGLPKDRVTVVSMPASKKIYVPNLLEPVRKRAVILEKFDPTEAAKEFLAQRDRTLPH